MATNLTALHVKNAKPKPGKYTLAAGKGLTLIVMPDGAKYWRLRYRFGGKAKWISVGRPYPETELADARLEADRLRALIAAGTDPAEAKRVQRRAERDRVANTFGEAAEAWFTFRQPAWKPRTAEQVRGFLEKPIRPKLYGRPLDAITPPELGEFIGDIEDEAPGTATKVRTYVKLIFEFARAKGWTKADPARDLSALAKRGRKVRHYPHVQAADFPALLRAIDEADCSPLVKVCAKLSIWTANRPGVTRTLRWSEVDLDGALWTIDRDRDEMKGGYYHLTPLPRQAVAALREVRALTGTFEYVFIGRNDPSKPLSDGAVNQLLKRIGYRGKQTAHGFRHVVSTALNELGYEPDWVERQLSHGDPDKIRATYNKAQYLDQRRNMMQRWADYLDGLKAGGNVVPIRREVA